MANDRAVQRNSIVIDNKSYRTKGKVRLFDASQQPGKIVIGESSAADNPHASEWNMGDFRGGIGIERLPTRRRTLTGRGTPLRTCATKTARCYSHL